MDANLKNWKQAKNKIPVPKNVVYGTEGRWETVSYSASIAAGEQLNVESHLVDSGTWIHLHLSTLSKASSATQLQKLRKLLRSFTFYREK